MRYVRTGVGGDYHGVNIVMKGSSSIVLLACGTLQLLLQSAYLHRGDATIMFL
jgi:hypothetical protein